MLISRRFWTTSGASGGEGETLKPKMVIVTSEVRTFYLLVEGMWN